MKNTPPTKVLHTGDSPSAGKERKPELVARGKRLRLAREKRGYGTQAALSDASAAMFGEDKRIGQSVIAMIEIGARGGDRSVRSLSKLLQVDEDWLYAGIGPEPDWRPGAPKKVPDREFSWQALRCAEIYDQISDPTIARIALAQMTQFDMRGQPPSRRTSDDDDAVAPTVMPAAAPSALRPADAVSPRPKPTPARTRKT